MEKEDVERYNLFRKNCLQNSSDLLDVAKFALENKKDHIAFHLTALALEEIGKVELVAIKSLINEHAPQKEINLDIEDHEKKLFWAIWGPSFGRELQTKDYIEGRQGLAKTIHERRKKYLYSDPTDLVLAQEKMEKGEAEKLYDFVYARYQLETTNNGMKEDMTDKQVSTLKWFMEATSDPEKRKEIFGPVSQAKLIELADSNKWIDWLKEKYEKNAEELRAALALELSRKKPPTNEEGSKPKWRIKAKVVTPSHAIRSKVLNEFNSASEYVKLYQGGDKKTILIELILPASVPLAGLWQHGWAILRMFISALNIATRGFFWWDVPRTPARYYEEIWDLEANLGVTIGPTPLDLDWKSLKWVLREDQILLAGSIFNYIVHLFSKHQLEALDLYANGLALFGKNDIHLRVEVSAFEQFYLSLKKAMALNGDWHEGEDFKEVAKQHLSSFFINGETADLEKILDLGSEIERTHKSKQEITITDVAAMKIYCDLYFQKLTKDYLEKLDLTEKNKSN